MRPPGTDSRVTEGNYKTQDPIIPPPPMRPHQDGESDTHSEEQMGRSQTEACRSRNRRGSLTGASGHDQRRTRIWRGSLRVEDAVSECLDISSQRGPGCSPGSGRQRTEIS
jgi:hypothetical protein